MFSVCITLKVRNLTDYLQCFPEIMFLIIEIQQDRLSLSYHHYIAETNKLLQTSVQVSGDRNQSIWSLPVPGIWRIPQILRLTQDLYSTMLQSPDNSRSGRRSTDRQNILNYLARFGIFGDILCLDGSFDLGLTQYLTNRAER